MIWFTSDLHFGHARVIEYAKRPFASVEEMDRAMIDNWNALVQAGDQVYVLGDFSFHKPARTMEILKDLNGQKFLIRGNHDRRIEEKDFCPHLFAWIKDVYTVKVPDLTAPEGKQRIVLCHYAFRVWDKAQYGSWHLYGHSHGSLPDDLTNKSFDIGVDAHRFFPVSYTEVKRIMADHGQKVPDHHGRKDRD